MSASLLEIDGSQGEGGGQILRSSLALALITGRPFRLRNIRVRRSRPGLQPQHLASVRAAAEIGSAQLRGACKDSIDLQFEPAPVKGGYYRFAIGTAGATSLVLQTIYLPLALRSNSNSEVTIEGGTHVTMSPCYHFLETTWRRYLGLLGMEVSLDLDRPGFYPRGGGRVVAQIKPSPHISGLNLMQMPAAAKATGFSAVAGLPEDIAQRQARRATYRLREAGLDVDLRLETWPGGPGTVLAIELDSKPVPTLFFALGARGKRAETVADEAVDQVLVYLKASPAGVDPHSADQLVLPLALAAGPSAFRVAEVTLHLLTNIAIIRRFVDREIVCDGEEGGPGVVRIA